jgi:hypothetical protein
VFIIIIIITIIIIGSVVIFTKTVKSAIHDTVSHCRHVFPVTYKTKLVRNLLAYFDALFESRVPSCKIN